MSDYIKREDVINIINYWWGDSIGQWLVKKIRNVPSADVAPVKHGRWDSDMSGAWCSVCGEYSEGEWNYCPNCGAKMDG